MPRPLRTIGFGALAVIGTLASCAADSTSSSTLAPMVVSTTAFATMPPVTTTPTTLPGQTTTVAPGAPIDYQIKYGDALYAIAATYGVTAEDIVTLNGWSSVHHDLVPGQTIKVPAPAAGSSDATSSPATTGAPADTGVTSTATTAPATATDPSVPGDGTTSTTAAAGEGQAYEVKNNDTVYGIARKFGITPAELVALNGWSDVNHSLHPGDTITVPAEAG